MSSNAPGQLLGYGIQFPRALYHLLKSGPGDCVSIEVIGDVAKSNILGEVIAEEDKSSIVTNPVTDRSSDLWKTFYNWIVSIKNKKIEVEKTWFVLYSNHSGRKAIVNEFDSVKEDDEIEKAINSAKEVLQDIGNDHEIWKYLNYCINENVVILKQIIKRFSLEIGSSIGYKEVYLELQKKHISEGYIKYAIDELSGWVMLNVLNKISSKTDAIISWDEFNHRISVLFARIRCYELIDFTISSPPNSVEINNQIMQHPLYIKQLESICSSEDDIIEAVTDFIRSDINLEKWIENEIIDDELARDFESKLKRFWESKQKSINITQRTLSDIEKGQLLLNECKSRQESIRDMRPPDSTIVGTYHSLADEPIIGWHNDWARIFSDKKEN